MKSTIFSFLVLAVCTHLTNSCTKNLKSTDSNTSINTAAAKPGPTPSGSSDVTYYLTKGDQSVLLQKQNVNLVFNTSSNRYLNITIDTTQQFQSIDGFGYTLTGGSAEVINSMNSTERTALLREMFSNDSNAISVSYLRLTVGASDLSSSVYSYDDMPAGQTDPNLQHFSLRKDSTDVLPILKQIIAINPSIKLLATPWSAPVWMKDNNSSVGGSLLPQYLSTYANYLVKYIQSMKAQGITIDAITPQNEPLNPNNNPSMYMPATQEDSLIKLYLGSALQSAGLSTKIILYDHNCDHPEYPTSILDDAAARPYIDGSAFHLYAGTISALTTVHNAYPNKNVYFTEQYTASTGNFSGDLKWHLKNVIIGATTNWSRNALEWNLANDPNYGPHTNGGCTTCKGALTIGTSVNRNVAYYIVAHASKFVTPGSVRVASNVVSSLYNVAFVRPDGKKFVIMENDGNASQTFNLVFKGKWVTPTLAAGAVATFIW